MGACLLDWGVAVGLLSIHFLAAEGWAGETPAFPGAEGFGRFATGGRGGDVYHVTNLQDAGAGSLRQGFGTAVGPRTIVFDVSGIIELKSKLVLEKSAITIAGQTAPGDGITLKDCTFQIRNGTNVIVRYLRCRLGDQNKPKGAKGGDDTLNTEDVDQVIFDHCSLSWAIDGTHDLRRGGNFTLQWCILSEALNQSLHNKGEHAMCASYRDLAGKYFPAPQSLCHLSRSASDSGKRSGITAPHHRFPQQHHLQLERRWHREFRRSLHQLRQ